MNLFLSFRDQEYSRTAVYFAGIRGEKQFLMLPNPWFKMVREVLKVRKRLKNRTKIIVGNPSHLAVPFLRILTKNTIIFDAGWPLSDSTTRKQLISKTKCKLFLIDFLAFKLAHQVVVESEEQKDFINHYFFIRKDKIYVILTGFNEIFYQKALEYLERPLEINPHIIGNRDMVFFRGKYNLEAGIDTIIEAANLMDSRVLIVIATNCRPKDSSKKNVLVLDRWLKPGEVAWLYKNSKIVLGQMGIVNRLERTIPHKFFEAAAFAKCYVTPTHLPLQRICGRADVRFIAEPSPKHIVRAIEELLKSGNLTQIYGARLQKLYQKSFSQEILCKQFERLIHFSNSQNIKLN